MASRKMFSDFSHLSPIYAYKYQHINIHLHTVDLLIKEMNFNALQMQHM